MNEEEVKKLAEDIIALVGGKENIIEVGHCATRLRLKLNTEKSVDKKAVENLPKVMGQFHDAGTYQVVLGLGLTAKVSDAIRNKI